MESNSPSYSNLIIARIAAEVATKSRRTRPVFQKALERNIREALNQAEIPHRLTKSFGRLFIETDGNKAALGILTRVFGIGSFSPVEAVTEAHLEAITRIGQTSFAEQVRGRRYAVRAKRIGQHPFSSSTIERELGAALNPYGKVDLENPEVTIHVEVQDCAYLFTERYEGPGGLPLGTQVQAITLISGGFDSAVAAWQVMKRGVATDYLLCNLGGNAYERMVLQVTKILTEAWNFGYRPRFYVVDFNGLLQTMREKVRPEFWQIILKRLMYRAASQIATEIRAEAIVTGEALGQVSSQTLSNLRSIDVASEFPVLRPLIGFDKQEIIDQARHIGTASLSERIKEYCAIVPDRPAVESRKEEVDAEEKKIDGGLLTEVVAHRKQIDLHTVTAVDLRTPYLFTREIPKEATVIDCQPQHMYRAWHVPSAQNRDPMELAQQFRNLDKNRQYVLYCTWGTQTAYIAELMQQFGYEAYAFEGGVSSVKKYLEESKAE